MTHLYLTRSDIKLGFSQGQLVVKGSADEPERRLPFCNVESINVFGNPQISTQLVRECLLANVPVGYYSEDGHYFGRAVSSDHVDPYTYLIILIPREGTETFIISSIVVSFRFRVDHPYSPRGDGNSEDTPAFFLPPVC